MKKALLVLLLLQLWALSADASVKHRERPTQKPATETEGTAPAGVMQELSGFISPFLSWRFNSGPGSLWPGNIPIFPHTNYPSTPVFTGKDGEDSDGGTREPLQPDTDDVLNPEIGLQEFSMGQADGNKGENTFSLAQFNINDMMNELFRSPKPSRWWEGPHVCVRKNVKKTNAIDEDMQQLKSSSIIRSVSSNTCTLAAGTYECILSQMVGDRQVTTTTTFECCEGYENSFKGTCEKVDILPIMDTIIKMNATQFIDVLDGKEDYIKKENITLFLPSNEAFEKFSNHMLETNNINLWVGSVDLARRRRDADDLNEMTSLQMLASHMVSGVHKIKPGDSLKSLTNSSLNVQEAYTSTGDSILLVNCAKVVSPNVATKGGMIHQVDQVLMPVKKSLLSILKDTPELSNFYESLQRSGLDEFISDDEDWTIFAPTNKAFDDLDSVFQNQLYDGNSSCAINLLKHHITPEPLCSLTAEGKTIRMSDSLSEIMVMSGITVESDATAEPDTLGETVYTINNVRVIRPDLVGTNGVIHIIEEVMVPEAAFPISNLLEKKNLTQFLGIIERAGLKTEMDSWSDVTMFIPTDVAIETFLKKAGNNRMKNVLEYEDFTSTTPLDKHSKRDLKNFVLHHITKGNLKSCGMEDNAMLDTMDRSQLRTNLYSTLPPFVNTYNRATVNCARLLHFDTQQCDNVLHQIDRPLLNIDGTILDLIKAHPELSMLHKVVSGSDMEAILRDKKDITFVAPVNEAFQAMENAEYEELLGDKQTVTNLLTRHTFKDVRCCAGLHNFPWTASLTCIDDKFTAQFRDNQIGSATIKKCDLMASNGVVHLTNKIMFKHMRPRSKNPNIDILLYGL